MDKHFPLLTVENRQPDRINFVRYNKVQVLDIIQDRMKYSRYKASIFDTNALQLISTKVGAHSGDLRKAFEICR